MPSYQVYIPNVTGADPQHLVRAGLDILDPHSAPTAVDAIPGPDGGRGVIFYWPHAIDDYNPQPGYHPETQEWVQGSGIRVQGSGFWLGRSCATGSASAAVEPESLLRRRSLAGTMLELADGQPWLIPAAPMLPQRLGIDASGRVGRQVQPRYQRYWDQVVHYYEQFLAIGEMFEQGQQFSDSIEQVWAFAVETLALNYRVDAHVVSWLGLFDEQTIVRLVMHTFEGDLVRLHDAVKKKCPTVT